ncbi:hypothetical protein BDZ89DRAFT_1177431 [Hymenopellis radicata]|nr:hypothetical protein BDZ89DRAFT_1177431 [Hymenopellis radicata]
MFLPEQFFLRISQQSSRAPKSETTRHGIFHAWSCTSYDLGWISSSDGSGLSGAGSVLQHVIANDGRTLPALFRGAITSSTFLTSQYAYNHAIPEVSSGWPGIFDVKANHCEGNCIPKLSLARTAFCSCSSSEDALNCLRHIDTAILQAVNNAVVIRAFYGTFVFNPVVDGTLITKRPSEALRKLKGVYLRELYPTLSAKSVKAGAAVYSHAGLGSAHGQILAIYSSYARRISSSKLLMAEFAIPPAILHGLDVVFYFPSCTSHLPPKLLNGPPYQNTDFDTAFAASFPGFASTLNPADTLKPTIIPARDRFKVKGRRPR